jgi:hypothetical protein
MSDPFERATIRAEMEHHRRRDERRAHGTRTGFRIHLTVYVGVQILLFAIWGLIWALGGDGYPWPIFPLLGWGVGLAAHYAAVRGAVRRAKGS